MDGEEANWNFSSIQPGETISISVNISVSDQLQSGALLDNRLVLTADGIEDTISLSSVVSVN